MSCWLYKKADHIQSSTMKRMILMCTLKTLKYGFVKGDILTISLRNKLKRPTWCFLSPFVSFRSTRNLKSYLVRSKIYPLERKVGSEKCKSKRCLVCLNVSETDVFQSFQTKEQYKINHQLNCNDKCLIYLLFCKVCGLQ